MCVQKTREAGIAKKKIKTKINYKTEDDAETDQIF